MFTPSRLMALVCAGAFCATGVVSVLADSITLNSGEQIEGKITSETTTQVVVNVSVSAGITDERVLSRTDIKSLTKTLPDEQLYQEQGLKEFKPGPNSLPAARYSAILLALNNFQAKFPNSAHSQEIRLAIDALKEDQTRVLAGDMKWNNCWYTAKELAEHKTDLGAEMALATMREQASRGDLIGALNSFDRLEKDYPGSSAYPEAVEFALALIPRLSAMVDHASVGAKTQEQQFNQGLVLTREPEKSQMRAARNAQIAAAEAAFAAAAKPTIKWKPLLPMTSKSPEALKATISSETTRLSALPMDKIRQSIALTTELSAALAKKNLTDIETKLKTAQTLWPANDAAKQLDPAVAAAVKADKAEKEKAKKAATLAAASSAKSTPTPPPSTSASTPTPTPKKAWYNPF